MVVLAVTWKAQKGQEEKTAEIFAILTAASRQEPGCLMYLVHRHRDDPPRFFVYEQYRDDAALQAHRTTLHFKTYARGELPTIANRMEADLYEPLPERRV